MRQPTPAAPTAFRRRHVRVLGAFAVAAFLSSPAAGMDEAAAKDLIKRNDCGKCHAVDKTKKGPSFKKMAEKYKDKPGAERMMVGGLITPHKVKLEDGTMEEHKTIDTKDSNELKNLVQYILSH